MKAGILKAPKRLVIEEVSKPRCPPGGLLVETQACSICSTDVKMFYHGQRDLVYPRILGHEVAGVVAENRSHDTTFKIGAQVQVAPGLCCGECAPCRRGADNHCDHIGIIGFNHDGGFAEFLAIPSKNVRSGAVNIIPDGLNFEKAALTEPLACCLNGQELSRISNGDTALIFGAGPIGCLHAMLARVMGAARVLIAESLQSRIKMAGPTKADRMIDVSNGADATIKEIVEEETEGRGVDVILLACQEATMAYPLLELLAPRGRICLFSGLPPENALIHLNANLIHYRDIALVGAYGCTTAQNAAALKLIASDKVKVDWLITKRISLDQIHEGIEHAAQRKGLKAIVTEF
ncbi:MAG: alcohol dehydrogenase catalytic domain-containing protein [Candidatus Methylarchaceae archaeon HK02M1]|nr:alcohol dehydrogenase catalytic domain-containing protein [Candidatus Methylarchaceae archaeon HK02M1]